MAKTRRADRTRRFYEKALNAAERADFPVALDIEGVDQEIAVLRLRLRSALQDRPEDLPLMLRGAGMLARLLAAKYRLPKADQDAINAAVIAETEGEVWPRGGTDDD